MGEFLTDTKNKKKPIDRLFSYASTAITIDTVFILERDVLLY